jgi:hypothetical protein
MSRVYHKFLDISIVPDGLNPIEANKPLFWNVVRLYGYGWVCLAFRTSQPYTSAQFTIYFSLNKSAVHISKRSAKLTQSTRCARIAGERERWWNVHKLLHEIVFAIQICKSDSSFRSLHTLQLIHQFARTRSKTNGNKHANVSKIGTQLIIISNHQADNTN